jgi:hypothetical protein
MNDLPSKLLPLLPAKELLFTVMPDDFRYQNIYGYTSKQMKQYAQQAIKDYIEHFKKDKS